jgi:aryl-alcohol dehydrogenase-like predicted oxidoreductase
MTDLRMALGTIPFGSSLPDDTSFALLDRFVEAGGTRIDTANNYPFWVEGCTGDESELAIGRWLTARGNRDRVVISTKCGGRPTAAGDTTMGSSEGLAPDVIRRAAEGSLARLGTDRIDVFWSHMEDRTTPLEDQVRAFGALVTQGSVRALGASNHATWRVDRARQIALAAGLEPYTAVQLRHTYLQPRPGVRLPEDGHKLLTPEMLDYVATERLALWTYNTLMFGAYTRADRPINEIYDHPGTTRRLAVLHDVAGELGVTANQVVLAWLVAQGIVPIVGATRPEQLDEAIAGVRLELEPKVVTRLDDAV